LGAFSKVNLEFKVWYDQALLRVMTALARNASRPAPLGSMEMSIQSFTDLYQRTVDDRKILGVFLSGHLAIEYLLKKLIAIYDPALIRLSEEMTHARLIALNADIGTINRKQCEVLVRINKIRNKFAHEITYEPTVDDLKELFRMAADAFSDQTDGISQGLEALDSCTGLHDLEGYAIPELFIQISYDLHEEYHSRGGDIEEF